MASVATSRNYQNFVVIQCSGNIQGQRIKTKIVSLHIRNKNTRIKHTINANSLLLRIKYTNI